MPAVRVGIALTLGMATAMLVGTAAAPAHADPSAVGLSYDGVHWSSHISTPLFSPKRRWVPGDLGTRSFWVRDQGPTGARLTIKVVSSDPDMLLADHDISLRARVAGGEWVRLTNGRPARRLTDEALQKGGARRVDVRAVFDPLSMNRSQRSRLPLRFVVTLTQAVADESIGRGGNGGLPNTGSEVRPGLVWLAATLIGSGLALVVAARRRREDEEVRHG